MPILTHSFLENILNNIADPVFVKNEKHQWVLLNEAFCNMLGRPMSDLIGKSDYDFFPKEEADVFWEKDQLVFNSEIENINEEYFTGTDGKVKSISTKKNIVRDDNGNKFLVGVIHDITEKKKLINNLKESNAMLENYAYLASHDLKSPLRTMRSYSQLLIRTAKEKFNDKEIEFLEFINKAATNMSNLVDKLLDFSKVNNVDLDYETLNLESIINEIKDELLYDIKASEAKITFESLPNYIKGDKKLIKLLFQNLISNAIKFKAPERKPSIIISAMESENSNEIHVLDNGLGIALEHKETIFKLFKKQHNNLKYEGSGIGLALCSFIVGQHSGQISVNSEVGKGSDFVVTIPKM